MTASVAPVMSFNCKAYYSSGTYASPSWVLMTNVGEVSPTDEMDWVDVPLRANGGFMAGVPGFRKVGFAWKELFNLADTAQAALRAAYDARTPLEFAFLDQLVATSGATGIRGTYFITKFARLEEDGKPAMCDIEIKPAATAGQPPERMTTT